MLTVYEDRDSSLLSLFRCLLQCTIQLIVQLYSLLHHYQLEHVHNSSEYNHQFTGKLGNDSQEVSCLVVQSPESPQAEEQCPWRIRPGFSTNEQNALAMPSQSRLLI